MALDQNFPHPPQGHFGLVAYDSANDRWQVVHVDASGNLQVDAVAQALPSGAATAAKQLPNGHAVTVDNVSLPVTGAFYPAVQPVNVEAYDPVPTIAVWEFAVDTDALTGVWTEILSVDATTGKTWYITDFFHTVNAFANATAYTISFKVGGVEVWRGIVASGDSEHTHLTTPCKATTGQAVVVQVYQTSGSTVKFCGGFAGFEV